MLALNIRSNNNKGLEIQGLKTKVSMYADDSSFILSPQDRSLQCFIEGVHNFAGLYGLIPNYDKCAILRIRSLKNTHFTLPCSNPMKWAGGEVDILGIHITKYINKLSTMNFNRKLVNIDKILQPRRGKYLSFYGKKCPG